MEDDADTEESISKALRAAGLQRAGNFTALTSSEFCEMLTISAGTVSADDTRKGKAWIAGFLLSPQAMTCLDKCIEAKWKRSTAEQLDDAKRRAARAAAEASTASAECDRQREQIRALVRERDEGRIDRLVREAVIKRTDALQAELRRAQSELAEANQTIETLRADKKRLKASRRV